MEELFEEERIARIAGDTKALEHVHSLIIDSCKTDDEIVQAIKQLTNKRKQNPQSVKNIIKNLHDQNKSVNFYKALLINVIEGKIYLEEERIYISELIKTLLANDIEDAYSIIKRVPVETFTTINERKRNSFLFEQFRLSLLLQLYSDAELFMRKVRKGYLLDEEKIIFLNYCILLQIGKNSFLEVAKLYVELNIIENCKKNIVLGSFYCMISSCLIENRNVLEEKNKLLLSFKENKMNDVAVRSLVDRFYSDMILELDLIGAIGIAASKYDNSLFVESDSSRNMRFVSELKASIIEHNFFIVKKFFSKIRIEQLCSIMQSREDEVIAFISEMVNEKYTDVKINQKDNLVNFGSKIWNNKVDGVLEKIETANNLIHKKFITED